MSVSSTFIPHKTPDATPVADVVPNYDPFFPDISLSLYRKEYRNDDTVTDERLRENIETAILFINKSKSLKAWQIVKMAMLLPLSDEEQQLYRRAVYHRTKVLTIEQYIDIDTTNDGTDEIKSLNTRLKQEKQRERETIRLLTGRNRTTIELL